jgi:DMSO/TMAO reductase YedYZ molybdopterin-dependent catalytic subunit
MTIDSGGTPRRVRRRGDLAAGAVIGLLCVGTFLGVAQLGAAVWGWPSAPVYAIGETFIDHTPLWLKSFAAETFGTNDKAVLIGGVVAVIAVAGALVGALAVRRPWVGNAGILALALIAGATAYGRPDASSGAVLPALVGTVAATLAYEVLRKSRRRAAAIAAASPARRQFLVTSAAVTAGAAVAGIAGGRVARRGAQVVASRNSIVLPAVSGTVTAPSSTMLDVPGLPPFFTPSNAFYRIDTELSVPQIDRTKWQLRIHGMVDKELTFSYDDLLAMPLVDRDITLCCVSNPVGGPYIGNARWTGVLLAPLLAQAGLHPDGTQLLSTSADGWTCGTPTAVVTDGRAAMIAIAQNGQPLRVEHGFPARMVVPGLYGYVSATKWLTDIRVTTMADKGYWITRGWSQEGPVKTQSRIDVPRKTAAAGVVPIAGVAWAQHKGIAKVEVQIDDGAWIQARLATEDVTDTWRQWVYDGWQAPTGPHTLRVRATDKTGYTQTAETSDVAPDGATGYHEVTVNVR